VTSIYVLLSLPLFALTFFIVKGNSLLIFRSPIENSILLFAFTTTFLVFFQSVFISIYQITKKAKNLTLFQISLGLLTLAGNIYLVYYLRLSVFGYFCTSFFVTLIAFLYILFIVFKNCPRKNAINLKIEFGWILSYLKTGFPFMLGAFSLWLLAGVDRWIILNYLNESEVGVYSVAYRFASVYHPLVIIPLLNAYTPKIFEKFAQKEYKQKIYHLLSFAIVVFSILALITPYIAKFMIDKTYYDALPLIRPLVLGYGIFFLTQAIASILIYKKKIKLLTINVLVASFSNILFNLIFVSRWGLKGSIAAFVLGHLIWFIFTFMQAKRTEKILIKQSVNNEYR
jgi:O-antigen/teichoic acid export membrane protein